MIIGIIDLDNKGFNKRVLVGQEFGQLLQKETNLDYHNEYCDKIQIKIPSKIMAINPSFLEGFIGHIIEKLGAEEFHKKFKFTHDKGSFYNIEKDLNETIDRVLRLASFKKP